MPKALIALVGLLAVTALDAQIRSGDLLLASAEFAYGGVATDYFLDHYDASGTFVRRAHRGEPLPTAFQAKALYAPTANRIYYAENDHVVRVIDSSGVPASRFGGEHEWITAMIGDAAGNLYVGDSYGNDHGEILKYNASGVLIDRYPIDPWFSMDLGGDQCTLIYPRYNWRVLSPDWIRSWLSIDRYDLCQHKSLPPLVEKLDLERISILQLRILPDEDVLLLSETFVRRLDASGKVVWETSIPNVDPFFLSLGVTPESFWLTTRDGILRRYSSDSGAPLAEPVRLHAAGVPLAGSVIGAWSAARATREPVTGKRPRIP